MIERLNEPVAFFLLIMIIILVTPLLSERVHLPGIIGIIIGGMLIGPHGFHLIEAGDRMVFLSTIGLVYLMFSAGLEVDINQFMRVRSRALVFGFFTFLMPQLMGMALGKILGLDWLGMILLGSAFASHTLIAFPILTRLGVTRNEAVAVTTGATVLTDIGAFIVLMILLTSITSPLIVQHFAADLQTVSTHEKPSSLFGRILVPIIDPQAQEQLLGLAVLLAKVNAGKVLAVSVAQAAGEQEKNFALHRDLLGKVYEVMNDPESEIELIPRLAATHSQGILYTSRERNNSIILMGWRGKRTLRESLLGSVLDEVIWGSNTPVMVCKLTVPLNGTQRVEFILPPKAIPQIAVRRMLEANISLAKALNVPLVLRADSSYLQLIEALRVTMDSDHPISVEALKDQLKPAMLEQESISSFIVVPGFGSRKRVTDTLGHLPERLAASFDGNVAILHFDK